MVRLLLIDGLRLEQVVLESGLRNDIALVIEVSGAFLAIFLFIPAKELNVKSHILRLDAEYIFQEHGNHRRGFLGIITKVLDVVLTFLMQATRAVDDALLPGEDLRHFGINEFVV